MADPLLRVRRLCVQVPGPAGGRDRTVFREVEFELEEGGAVVLTGPSGAGKSLLARCLLGLLPPGSSWSGEIFWQGRLLRRQADWAPVRGRGMTLVLQEPRTALNPVLSVGDQLRETIMLHQGIPGRAAVACAEALLGEVRLAEPGRLRSLYPHQLSGGMRQRVLLACALACNPSLLIADEITSALDAATRGTVLTLLEDIRVRRNMALLLITHDSGLVDCWPERPLVLQNGQLKERVSAGGAQGFAGRPAVATVQTGNPVLEAKALTVAFPVRSHRLKVAVADVDLALAPGRMSGLAGESGCGKSSLALALARHLDPVAGEIRLAGNDFMAAEGRRFRDLRRKVQILFQDPGASLDPRQSVTSALREASGSAGEKTWPQLLGEVGLDHDFGGRFAHQMSGGQRQRVALARCLAAEPWVLIADEPTTQLDPDTRDRIMILLRQVMADRNLAVLMISHDLPLLMDTCAEIRVMLGGRIVEQMTGPDWNPLHPYTRELLGRKEGENHPAGGLESTGPEDGTVDSCPFAGRCPLENSSCAKGLPPLRTLAHGHALRCHERP